MAKSLSITPSESNEKRLNSTNRLKTERILLIICFLAIPLTSLILFTYVPLVDMVKYSMYHMRGFTDQNPVFVAFGADSLYVDNYYTVFTNSEYWEPLKVSGIYLLGSFVQIALALYFATIFYFRPRGASFFKAIIFIPSLLNGVAISLMWLLILRPSGDGGVINTIRQMFGQPDKAFFGTFWSANIILAAISVWRYLGNNMVMFAGSMESISRDTIEASEIDGANKWKQFTHIILPSIKKIIFLNLILAINGAVQVFEIPYIMQPNNSVVQSFIMKTINIAFVNRDIGLGAALGIVMLVLVCIVALVQKVVEKKVED
jgi:ABC-type sugar transport system permease subunit